MNCFKHIEVKLLVIFTFFSCLVFSQVKENEKPFDIQVEEIANRYKSQTFFYKATLFYTEKSWDSTIVYTARYFDERNKSKELTDYCHYIRGFSFLEKKIFEESEKEFRLISTEFNYYNLVKFYLAEIALEFNQFKKAVSIYEELIKLPKRDYVYLNKSKILENLGLSYLHLEDFKMSETYLIKNLQLKEKQKDTIKIIRNYLNLANLYYVQYKDDLAISYFEKAYQLSGKIRDYKSKQNTALNMAVVEENRKNFKKALIYRKEYEQWKDSLNDQNKIYEVAKIEKEFAVKEKQKEVSLLQAENKAKVAERNSLFYSALTLLILLGITFYFYKEKNKANKIIVAQKEGLDELNATKDKLFSIVSHDLRSSVNALKTSNAKLLDNLEEKNLEALDDQLHNNSAIVNGAYNLLDNLLNWALLQTKQSYFEITAIRLSFIVEQMAYNYKPLMLDKSISFKNKVSKKDIVFADQESLKIILRNLLDNAIKFSRSNGKISIYTLNTKEGYLNLIIEDSGLGMTEKTRINLLKESVLLSEKENKDIIGTGLGLQLCKSLIKKNKGKFSIESELGKGTKMIVSLPKTMLNG